MSIAVTAQNLEIVRDGARVIHDTTFELTKGQITGLIGPSGSGKTTLMRAIIGAQKITSGLLTVLDQPAGSKQLRPKIGYVSQSPAIYDDLTVRQNVSYFAQVLNVPASDVTRVLGQVDLAPESNQLAQSLSGGQRARVSLAIALLGNAELLVLDEPTVGLDPLLRRELWNLFAHLAREDRTLLISSHVMDEAEQCPELILMRDGTVLSSSTKQELLNQTHAEDVESAFITLIGDRQ
jgi:ABC-2 type transport system ATP-binding protein